MSAAPDLAPTSCQVALSVDDLDRVLDIRRAVFVEEQGLFAGSDLDDHDDDPSTIHVLGTVGGVPAGTVRLYPLEAGHPEGDWQGDRLAVLPGFRASGLGAPLVRFAVATAGRLGGARMVAHVQMPNEVFFRRLGWSRLGDPEIYVGHPHLLMEIDLHAARAADGPITG
ncbi:MSMEG_0567/Sll0786 family nitrogen starvation N-acetyltransferase [Pseudonocardia sp. N23]|uniref:MSMEG_0567/Sll0786 family nitrogen starvation N-acetyltransferase n=1 Tax=Pseudonocardia sp. N23 TaxID=1987376 RepID=UPI000BFD73AC|nr:MSMEG_0567/Sll0786 family nitrogen starvation N-acetyltransferase [Pseudonocardia sp. N23]GAY08676.1 selenophosphate synthetase-related protein [Pseudonocardia sp. N23]